ncbi:uncharacterized protein L969DRAFT_95095 [Mixia osmundae IAM 14324]|uniref:Chitin-binding type-1 domain-containing protein n=1 Tax=Mixia osmundae (strain CBS 9802 / IAM 14324 / JCM 22182 / KY 12970) TaxID=764103 RepID=G7E770_MIXOS|nr:uncharacterized protein L969DRAFT_95095 [Mixia osmundae IAM 14324]KEI38935.1 hypothetical protein L969DRAFT_95095 [Mixia osmundae IAM 14324]GAA98680.1 hypothetical protein E5Q_05368 [Mixia osmundae IAM 14324]
MRQFSAVVLALIALTASASANPCNGHSKGYCLRTNGCHWADGCSDGSSCGTSGYCLDGELCGCVT